MATIESAVIFTGNNPNNQVDVRVICQIRFAESERNSQFRLECSVFGDDLIKDDFLFSYDPQTFFASVHFDSELGAPGGSGEFTFQKIVSRSSLNEDIVGEDELKGKLTLRNLTLGGVVKKNTNRTTV